LFEPHPNPPLKGEGFKFSYLDIWGLIDKIDKLKNKSLPYRGRFRGGL
jgi:hypothetical protein